MVTKTGFEKIFLNIFKNVIEIIDKSEPIHSNTIHICDGENLGYSYYGDNKNDKIGSMKGIYIFLYKGSKNFINYMSSKGIHLNENNNIKYLQNSSISYFSDSEKIVICIEAGLFEIIIKYGKSDVILDTTSIYSKLVKNISNCVLVCKEF